MANFDQLKQSVAALIRTNGAEEITGQIMQDVLLTIINSISGGYMFGGVAQHSGNVGNPDYNVFYLAGSGAYTGYGDAINIPNGCYGVFRYNGSWTQDVVDIGVHLTGTIREGETNGVTGDVINTALQQLFNNVMNILDTLTFTYNTPSAQQATKAMLDVIMTPTGGASHVLTTLTLVSATAAAAGLMSAEDKRKVDRMLTDFRSLSFSDTTAVADQATKIVQTLSATLGENPEAITTMTFLAATASKAGLLSAADKAKLDALWSSGYQFAGIATPSTTPVSTTSKIFYIATEAGTYFNAVTVTQGINLLSWNGTSWSAVQVVGIDDEPTAGSDNLVKSGGVQTELALGAVYDVSAHHNGATFESLSALLSDTDLNALIPTAVRKGGMSIKFVQSSDNKYVQYRLTADAWSTDTEDWAIADEGIYVENPEFFYVKADNEGKILWAIKTDGGIYYGAGCPQQVKDYIEKKIAELSLDEYEDIVAFLSDYLGSDTTLKVMIDGINAQIETKVDKEEGKSLINEEYSAGIQYIENPEFIHLIKDSNEKILEGTRTDGTKVFEGNVEVKGKQIIGGNEYSVVSSAEWIVAWLDAADKVIFGFKTNGKTFVGDADFLTAIKTNREAIDAIAMMIPDDIDWDALICMHTVDNPEYIAVETDSEDKILSGRNTDGSKFENFPMEFRDKVSIDGNIIRNIKDPKRVEIKTDSDDKIISYRDTEGVLHENVGLETPTLVTNSLNLTEQGMTEFQQALKDSGFKGGTGDWSEYLSNDGDNPLHISKPRRAIMNLIVDFNLVNLSKKGRNGAIQGVNYDIPTQIEFWDMQGNYFKKWALISGQGNSSMGYNKKNIAIDLFDSSVYNSKGKLGKGDVFSIKFGDWVPQDSFHLKANMSDTFRIVNQLSYSLYNDIVKTRGIRKDYMWKKSLIDFSSIGMTNVNKDVAEAAVDTGARCFPDGFPVIVYQNGEFWGIFHLSLKKHRDNFHMSKSNKKHIHLDGLLDDSTIFMANGNIDWARFTSHRCNWVGRLDGIEVRNPKDLYCVDVSYSYTALDATLDADEISKVIARHTYTNCTEDMTSATDTQIRETYGDNPPAYLLNTTSNVMYRIYETPTGTCDKYDADVNNHELIDDTMSCYDSTNKNHVTTNTVKHYIENFSRIMTIVNDAEQVYLNSEKTAQDLAALKEVFETYFDVENLIDYLIHGDITFNWDGFAGKNWQWFTYDGVKWYCGVYDCDLTFGKVGNIIAPIQGHTCQDGNSMPAHTLLMNRYILTYYETELNDRYKELRDKKVIDADRICSIISDMISIIGKDIYEAEWEKWSPEMPIDSIYRFQNWLSQNIAFKDTLYNYK